MQLSDTLFLQFLHFMRIMMHLIFLLIITGSILTQAAKDPMWDNDHQHPLRNPSKISNFRDYQHPAGEAIETDWQALGQRTLNKAVDQTRQLLDLNHPARNGIFLMGDGMGISTLTAARVYISQSRNLTGDDASLSWEKMPYLAFSKTYATDLLVSDSANTATAMMCGEKCRETVICANQLVVEANCSTLEGNKLKSILHHAIEAGKWTGFVTTSSLVDASPAVNYAHSPTRNWQADVPAGEEPCSDIASQLIDIPINHKIRVILGGGRQFFTPNTTPDPEYPEVMGSRKDNRSLIEEWKTIRASEESSEWAYVQNSSEFNSIDTSSIDYLMGLFQPNKMQLEKNRLNPEREKWGEPSLAEMVETAIKILSRGPNGYFLFVEGAQIDNGHHENNAHTALTETVALNDAVAKADEMTSDADTLMVVTADHSHVFNIAGYPAIYTNIFEYNDDWERGWGFQYAADGKPYTTLVYSNGLNGYLHHRTKNGDLSSWQPRKDLEPEKDQLAGPDMVQDSSIPRDSETHAGEDLAIFARGPMSYLFQGSQEQHYIAHVMKYAMCIGERQDLCTNPPFIGPTCSAPNLQHSNLILCCLSLCVFNLLKHLM